MGESQSNFASQIEDFKEQHIKPLHSKIVNEFSEGIDQGSSNGQKVAAMLKGVLQADLAESTDVLFDGILQFEDVSKDLTKLLVTYCRERLEKVATCIGQLNFSEAQEQLVCVKEFLEAAPQDQLAGKDPKYTATREEHRKQQSALDRARQNNVLNRFRFTSSEVPKCIELLDEQRLKDYTTFEASLDALEKTLTHENSELTALTSKPLEKLQMKDVQRIFEVSSGIIGFGSAGKDIIGSFASHCFRSMVGEAPHSLSSFIKKLLGGYEVQLKNFVKLADLSNDVQKLTVFLTDSGLHCWSDAKAFVEKSSKILQRCEKAIHSVKEASSTVKEFDIKKCDQTFAAKKLTETLSHLRKQERQSGHDCDLDDSAEDSETGMYQAVVAELSTQIHATSKLQVKIESDYKIHRDSFEQLFAAMKNCQVFEADEAIREIALRERTAAEKRLLQVINSVASSFSSLVREQNFQEVDVLVSTGKELDSIFFDSFGSCFPLNKALLQHFGDAFKSLLDEKQKSFSRRRDVKEYAHGMIDIRQISTAVSNVSLPEVRSVGDIMLKDLITTKLPANIGLFELVSDPLTPAVLLNCFRCFNLTHYSGLRVASDGRCRPRDCRRCRQFPTIQSRQECPIQQAN